MSELEIPEGLYLPHIKQSATYLTTFTVNAGTADEHEYDALNIDLPDLLDAIAAEGLPTACPSCGALSSLTVPLKAPLDWEVSTTHRNECAVLSAAEKERHAEAMKVDDRVTVLPVEPCALCGETLNLRTATVTKPIDEEGRFEVELDDPIGIHLSGDGTQRCSARVRRVRYRPDELALTSEENGGAADVMAAGSVGDGVGTDAGD